MSDPGALGAALLSVALLAPPPPPPPPPPALGGGGGPARFSSAHFFGSADFGIHAPYSELYTNSSWSSSCVDFFSNAFVTEPSAAPIIEPKPPKRLFGASVPSAGVSAPPAPFAGTGVGAGVDGAGWAGSAAAGWGMGGICGVCGGSSLPPLAPALANGSV